MITANMVNTPVRTIKAKAELYNGSALAATYNYNDALKSIEVTRAAESKFFGFSVCQKLNLKLIDKPRAISVTTENAAKVYFNDVTACPPFYVTEVHRDENTNELSITAYDALYKASAHTVAEIELTTYTIREFAAACAALIGAVGLQILGTGDLTAFDMSFPAGANFDGTEDIRSAINAIAEATQTICYIDNANILTFKRLDISGAAVLTISRADYFTLESGTNRRLATITHATELGDNITASTTESGSTQYIRDNPFWDLREDIADIVEAAVANVGGLTINQFSSEWRGNYLLELGDKIALITKDGSTAISYVLNDVISYSGAYSHKTEWSYADSESETAANPTNLGEAIKKTYAKVDKANKQIEIVAGEASANTENISSLILNTESISATVTKVSEDTENAISSVNEDIAALSSRVNATMTAEAVKIEIQNELANGTEKVVTTTGVTVDDLGVRVEKTDAETHTQITENGMTINKNDGSGEVLLEANRNGVNAQNLHATTYLIVGNNSRFEDYVHDGESRTGCFWIG